MYKGDWRYILLLSDRKTALSSLQQIHSKHIFTHTQQNITEIVNKHECNMEYK